MTNTFIYLKPKKIIWFWFLVLIIFSFLLTYLFNLSISDVYETKGYFECDNICKITSIVPEMIEPNEIKVNAKTIQYEDISYENMIDENNMQSYYKISILSEEKVLSPELVNIAFYYHKDKMITKVLEYLF